MDMCRYFKLSAAHIVMASLKVDYHFHPNLPSSSQRRQRRKARKIWQAFENENIDAAISTEHAYKEPEQSYHVMKQYKQGETTLFPGVECLTTEGLEIIVFSRDESVYDYDDITEPYCTSLDRLIDLVNDDSRL